jgi:hypothetical protein
MVFNELLFQYRGSISGWKLSPIRDVHRKKLQALPSRPNSTLPWMESSSPGSSTPTSNIEPARSKSTEPMASRQSHQIFEGVQGSNVLENSAKQQFFVIQRLHDRYAEKRNSQKLSGHMEEKFLHGPDILQASAEEQTMQSSTDLQTFSRPSSKSLSKGSGNFSQVPHENSGNNDTGVSSGDWFEPASSVGSAEPYLSYLKAKMTSTMVSRQSSLAMTH